MSTPVVEASATPRTAVAPPPALDRAGASRFIFIDGLRGIAASLVVVHHFSGHRAVRPLVEALPVWAVAAMKQGGVGVAIFFVISGFVIAHSFGRARGSVRRVGNFALRRSIRLDPPYWTAIAVVILAGAVKGVLFPGHRVDPPSAAAIAAHMTYTFEILGFPPILPVFWTLCHEVQFYLLYSLILTVPRPASTSREGWPVLTFVLTGALSSLDLYRVRGLCLPTWYMFSAGVLLYYAFSSAAARRACVFYFAFVVVTLPWNFTAFRATTLATAAALAIAAFSREGLTTWLSNRVVQYLGGISYSLYLIHGVVGWQVLSVGGDVVHVSTPAVALVWFVLAIALSLAAAHLMRQWIEIPSIALARRFKSLGAAKSV